MMMWCTISRYRISRRCDDGRPLGPLVRRHVENCPDCRQFQRDLSELARRLADDARRDAPGVSSELHQRILRAIDAEPAPLAAPAQAAPVPRPRLRLYALSSLAAAAAVLLTATILYVASRGPDVVSPPAGGLPSLGSGGAEILPELLEIPDWVVTQVTEPLHAEVRELARTGRQAAGVILDQASWLLGEDLPVLNGEAG